MSAEIVATMIASSSCGSVSAIRSAARAAAAAMSDVTSAVGGDVAFADAGALDDPFVARRDHPLEIGVGQHALGCVASRAEDA